jgi:hypothetical protein
MPRRWWDLQASSIAVPVTAGASYVVVVDGVDGAAGSFTLTVTPP